MTTDPQQPEDVRDADGLTPERAARVDAALANPDDSTVWVPRTERSERGGRLARNMGGGWNYRLVVTAENEHGRDVSICEVFYDDEGTPVGYVDRSASGDTREEALRAYEMMKEAFDRPVLRLAEPAMTEVSEDEEKFWLDADQD